MSIYIAPQCLLVHVVHISVVVHAVNLYVVWGPQILVSRASLIPRCSVCVIIASCDLSNF